MLAFQGAQSPFRDVIGRGDKKGLMKTKQHALPVRMQSTRQVMTRASSLASALPSWGGGGGGRTKGLMMVQTLLKIPVKPGHQDVNTLLGKGALRVPGLLVDPDHFIQQGGHLGRPGLARLGQSNTFTSQVSKAIGMAGLRHTLALRRPVIMKSNLLERRHDITTARAQP